MITIFTLCYNEKQALPIFVTHYRERFPNCRIVVYDNYSTDGTPEIAIKLGCEVVTWDSNLSIDEEKYLEIKNNCWKDSGTNWNFVGDTDELCEITESDLILESQAGTSFIQFTAYDMISLSRDPADIYMGIPDYGVRNQIYDKVLFIDKSKIREINYTPGCHGCTPKGVVNPQKKRYTLYHNRYLGEDFLVERYKEYRSRLSKKNLDNRWGVQYQMSESDIRENYKLLQQKSHKIK